jgi:hypothetical protein
MASPSFVICFDVLFVLLFIRNTSLQFECRSMVCPSGVTCELLFADHLQIFAVFIEAILTNHL